MRRCKSDRGLKYAEVLELEDSMDLKSIGVYSVRVQVPPSAHFNFIKMAKKIKKIVFPVATFGFSFYFCILFGTGLVIGYWITKIFHDKFFSTGKVKSIFLDFGKWRFHFHHWIWGVIIIFFITLVGWLAVFPKIFLGAICGLSLHDLFFDKNWYRVFFKKS